MARRQAQWVFADATERDTFGVASGVQDHDTAILQSDGSEWRWSGGMWVAKTLTGVATWAAVLSNGATSGGTSPTISNGDDILFAADNTSDIGSSAERAAVVYAGTRVDIESAFEALRTSNIGTADVAHDWYADGVLRNRWRQVGTNGNYRLEVYDAGGSLLQNAIAVNQAAGRVEINPGLHIGDTGVDTDTTVRINSSGTKVGRLEYADGGGVDGWWNYNHGDRTMRAGSTGTECFLFTPTVMRTVPATQGTMNLGDSTYRFGTANLSTALDINAGAVGAGNVNADIFLRHGSGGTDYVRWYNSAGVLRFTQIKNSSDTYALQVYDTGGVFQSNIYSVSSAGTAIAYALPIYPATDKGINIGTSTAGGLRMGTIYSGLSMVVERDVAGAAWLTNRQGDFDNYQEWQDLGVTRWRGWRFGDAASTDNLRVDRYDAAGAFQDSPIIVRGDSGQVRFANDVLPQTNTTENLGDGALRWNILFAGNRIDTNRSSAGIWSLVNRNADVAIYKEWRDNGVTRYRENFAAGTDPNLAWERYSAAGAFQDQPMKIIGSDGTIEFDNAIFAGGDTASGHSAGTEVGFGDYINAAILEIKGGDGVDSGIQVLGSSGTAKVVHQQGVAEWQIWTQGAKNYTIDSAGIRANIYGSDIGSASLPFEHSYWGNGSGSVIQRFNKIDTGTVDIDFQNVGVQRWRHQFTTGEALSWVRYDTGGVLVDTTMLLATDGKVFMDNQLIVGGTTTPTLPTNTRIAAGTGTQSERLSFSVNSTGTGGLAVGDPAGDPDEGLWEYTVNSNYWYMFTGGTERLRFTDTNIEAHSSYSVGSAGNPFNRVFLADATMYTGTTGSVYVNGTQRWIYSSAAKYPATDAGANLGTTTLRVATTHTHRVALPHVAAPSAITSHAVIYSQSSDNAVRVKYPSGAPAVRRLDIGQAFPSFMLWDGTGENAIPIHGVAGVEYVASTYIPGTGAQKDVVSFVPNYDCVIHVRAEPTDSANATFGSVTLRLYEGYDYGSGDVDNVTETISGSGPAEFVLTYTCSAGTAYALSMQPTTSDTSHLTLTVDLIPI